MANTALYGTERSLIESYQNETRVYYSRLKQVIYVIGSIISIQLTLDPEKFGKIINQIYKILKIVCSFIGLWLNKIMQRKLYLEELSLLVYYDDC